MGPFVILGCGYTGRRVARLLAQAGQRVLCTNRNGAEVDGAQTVALNVNDAASLHSFADRMPADALVLNSISSTDAVPALIEILAGRRIMRLVYLSTTGVYGAAELVDERTPATPNTVRDAMRLQTEEQLSRGPWSTLILRPAAIYGPGRGVHTSARTGVFRPPPGGNRIISRIHVDDLAEHALAAMHAQLTGAFPVADEEPSPSSDVAELAFSILGVPFSTAPREPSARDERKTGRRVDGSGIRRALNLHLRYPSYRQGVPACLDAEDVPTIKNDG